MAGQDGGGHVLERCERMRCVWVGIEVGLAITGSVRVGEVDVGVVDSDEECSWGDQGLEGLEE